jgi:hypothetical protein
LRFVQLADAKTQGQETRAMLAFGGRKLVLAGLLAAGFSASAWATDALTTTTQQAIVGEAATEVAALQTPPPSVANEAYATETTARPVSPIPTQKIRTPVRGEAYTPAPRYVASAAPRRSGCAHLGCRGVHVLGVGY